MWESSAQAKANLNSTQIEGFEVWQKLTEFSKNKIVCIFLTSSDLVFKVRLGFNKDSFMVVLCENSGTSDSLLDT